MAHSLPGFHQSPTQSSDQTFPFATIPDEQFLRLQIGAEVPVLLPIQQLTEVLSIPENQIMPMPHMPAWMMGIYNWRGEILWVADLGYLCGLMPWYQYPTHRSTYSVVILNLVDDSAYSTSAHSTPAKGQVLGCVVQQIEDMEQCDLDAIQIASPVPVSAQLAQLSAGYWQKPDGMTLAILSGEKLLSAISQA